MKCHWIQSASIEVIGVNRQKAIGNNQAKLWTTQRLKVSIALFTAIALAIEHVGAAIAIPIPVPPANAAPSSSTQEIDTSISRDYESATIYVHDPVSHKLVARTLLVAADQPVAAVVDQIIQAYGGQPIAIKSYEVKVDTVAHAAKINFTVDNPQGARVFESLSSTNQYSLFEAIRETLLNQPAYNIHEVIFQANGTAFDI